MKLHRQLDVRPFKYVDSQRFVLLLREERMSAEMSLVWLIILKALRKSIAMVHVRYDLQGLFKPCPILCASGRRVETVEWMGPKPCWVDERES